ncbi:MAG TPA: aldo/keto reductase [Propioniciclava tarda]|nr:aldo/keto reductase [Propioniciclava tarda]HQA30965.1 aldo/keto reductase [Propioniciclava tarda]
MYGAASLAAVSQEVADASVERALAAGINHLDTAATYGDSEERLGAMDCWRGKAFLATKVEERTAAWRPPARPGCWTASSTPSKLGRP